VIPSDARLVEIVNYQPYDPKVSFTPRTVLKPRRYLAYVLGAFLTGAAIPSGFLSLMFSIGLLISVNLFFLGIVGVYVARIYDEVRGRPTYLVSRVRRQRADDMRMRSSAAYELQSVSRGH